MCNGMDSINPIRFHERCHAIVSEELFHRIQKRPLFRVAFFDVWLREPDLNRRPSGYEPDELPDCSIPRLCVGILQRIAVLSIANLGKRLFLQVLSSPKTGLHNRPGPVGRGYAAMFRRFCQANSYLLCTHFVHPGCHLLTRMRYWPTLSIAKHLHDAAQNHSCRL